MIRWSPAAPARPSCPHRRLTRLLTVELGGDAALGGSTIRPWASANFVGARHFGRVPPHVWQAMVAVVLGVAAISAVVRLLS